MKCGSGPEVGEKMNRNAGGENPGIKWHLGARLQPPIWDSATGSRSYDKQNSGLTGTQVWRKNSRNVVIKTCCLAQHRTLIKEAGAEAQSTTSDEFSRLDQ